VMVDARLMTVARRRLVIALLGTGLLLLMALAVIASQLPAAGAGGLLHPGRRRVDRPPPPDL